ncbi:MAG: hypothetical protein A3J25_07600 [Pseudomonadales bacterium RIFCSPLOWO2_02_FULL_63_210]|nr:MAG: hypothetical protein A3J25_07600 [Pseudomonadales bacterium RIFCSPLOWO2_02_FULL_63_210]
MHPALALLLDCCQALLAGDQVLIARLRAAGFVCATAAWQFRLPALHAYLMTRLPPGERVDYPAFLRELYASDLNARLREVGAEIVIVDNLGKVDLSTYGLIPLTT